MPSLTSPIGEGMERFSFTSTVQLLVGDNADYVPGEGLEGQWTPKTCSN